MNEELEQEMEANTIEELKEEMLRVKRLEEPIYRFFSYEHLPEKLQSVSKMFKSVADVVLISTGKNDERTECLRKLLEAKDCAIRSYLCEGPL